MPEGLFLALVVYFALDVGLGFYRVLSLALFCMLGGLSALLGRRRFMGKFEAPGPAFML